MTDLADLEEVVVVDGQGPKRTSALSNMERATLDNNRRAEAVRTARSAVGDSGSAIQRLSRARALLRNEINGGSLQRPGTASTASGSTVTSRRPIAVPGSCPVTGKVQYATAREAHIAQRGLASSGHVRHHLGRPRVVRAYRCNHCGKWHLSSGDLKNGV